MGSALLLPVVAVLAMQVVNLNRNAKEEVENDAREAAERINQRMEAVAKSDLSALRVLAANTAPDNIDRSVDLAETAIQLNETWRSVVLFDRESNAVIFDAAKDAGAVCVLRLPENLPSAGLAEGVLRDGLHCPCVRLHVPLSDNPRYVLTVFIDPAVFQAQLMAGIPNGSVGAIVDREGEFLARSIDFDRRVGTPATVYVRDAVNRGGAGVYRGQTYEGFVNYTAYAVSPETGWSTHVAINHALIDNPRNMSTVLLLLGAIVCVAMAGGMIAYANFDIAVRRREEQRIIEMQKAEAVGEFTSTLVHDFRNLLAVMHASINLIVRQTEEKQTRETAEAARDVLERSEKLVVQFLNFARRDEPDNRIINLRAMLSGMMDLLSKSVGKGVEIVINAPEDFCFLGNVQQMELAFVNLLANARDAMNGSGKVFINAEIDGDMGVIRIADTGPGVPKFLRQRVFEAFFTTKPAGKGTGLGLSQVGAAVRQAGGAVEIDEGPVGGAVFIIRLSLADTNNVVELTSKSAG